MDIIKIKDKNKGYIEMEVVLTYKYNEKDYLIYKDNDSILYIARYNYENDKLDTNLTDEEVRFGEKILKEAKNNVQN